MVRFIDFTVTAWLVVKLSDNPSAVGLLVFFRIIPFLVLGPYIGTLLDRYPRIRIFRSTQVGLAVAAGTFAMVIGGGFASLTAIYVYSAISGSLMACEIASRRAYLASIVGPAALGSALALEMVSLNVAWFIGTNLGGLVAKLVNPSAIFLVISISFFANFYVLRRLPRMFRPDQSSQAANPFKSFADGYKLVRSDRAIMIGLLVVGINNFFGYGFESMAPAFARERFGAGPTEFGLLMSAQALGALIVAGYIATKGRRISNPGLLLLAAAIIQCVGCIGYSFAQTFGIGFVSLIGLGFVSMVFGIAHTTLILRAVPPNFRGRIMGFQLLMMGLFPIGSLALGFTADLIGLGGAVRLFSFAGLILLTAIWVKYPVLRKPIT
jgi:MFS family permease